MRVANEKKKELFDIAYKTGKIVSVIINTKVKGVLLPDTIMDNHNTAMLNYAVKFNLPRFEVTDNNIIATLQFKGVGEVVTMIPWESVIGISYPESGTKRIEVTFVDEEPEDDTATEDDMEIEYDEEDASELPPEVSTTFKQDLLNGYIVNPTILKWMNSAVQ